MPRLIVAIAHRDACGRRQGHTETTISVVIAIGVGGSTRLDKCGQQVHLVVGVAHCAPWIGIGEQIAHFVVGIGEYRPIGQRLGVQAVERVVDEAGRARVIGEGQNVAIVVVGVARG